MHLFPMLIFFNMVSSQSDETGILDILEIEFFEKKKTLFFKKNLSVDLHFGYGNCNFLEKR